MNRTFVVACGFLLLTPGVSRAQTLLADIDLSALGCPTKSTTPATAAVLGPSDTQQIRIGTGVYATSPCKVYIVEWSIASNAGSQTSNISPSRLFSFDSISNEAIDTEQKCETYSQLTTIYKKPSGGNWTAAGFGTITGQWVNGKCHYLAGTSDFRKKSFHPPSSGTDKYRVASRVLTGTAPNTVTRGVCVGAKFADIQNVLRRSCDDPPSP